jgi:hypothetical protein
MLLILRALLVRLMLATSLVACLLWLAICFLLMPVMLCVRRAQRKGVV